MDRAKRLSDDVNGRPYRLTRGSSRKEPPGDSACMTVSAEVCSWVDAEVRRTNEGTKTEQAGYVGAQINNPRNAKDSQGTERPLRVLLLLFAQAKRRPRRRRGGKDKIRREPPPPRRGGMKHPSTKKEEKSGAARRAADCTRRPAGAALTNPRRLG